MSDKEIYQKLLADDQKGNVVLEDDNDVLFELRQVGLVPMHGVHYAICEIVAMDGKPFEEEDGGIVMLELDYDDEDEEYFVVAVEDDDIFDEVMEVFEDIPVS
jgi:hypothetical protein